MKRKTNFKEKKFGRNFSPIVGITWVYIFLLLISCSESKEKTQVKKVNPPLAVDILSVQKEAISSDIEVNGVVLAMESIEIRPESSGKVIFLNMPDGGKVKAGALLARINDADLQAQYRLQLAQLDLAKKNEQRLNKLLEVGGVDQASYDAALNQLKVSTANVELLTAQIEKTMVKAPFSGVLGLRQISEGAYVSPTTIIGTLCMNTKLKIDFTVPESYVELLDKGNNVGIETGNIKTTAVIVAIEPQLNTSTRNIKVRAIAEAQNLIPGSFVKVILTDHQKRMMVPTQAVIPDALSNQVVLAKNGKAVFKNVVTGMRTPGLVEITSGIEVGDSVIISGMLYLRPGADLKIKDNKQNQASTQTAVQK